MLSKAQVFFWGGAVSDFIELDLKKNDIVQ